MGNSKLLVGAFLELVSIAGQNIHTLLEEYFLLKSNVVFNNRY